MKLDLRSATIVLTGAWNTEIFTAPWIAVHLYDYHEGDKLNVDQVIITSENEPPKQILFIDGIGISLSGGRLELYATSFDENNIASLESVAKKVVSTLQHTPMGAMGINFNLVEEDPSEDLEDKLKSPDGIERTFDIKTQSFTATIALENEVDLNLTRAITDEFVKFSFNYHFSPLSPAKADNLIDSSVTARYEQTKEFMQNLYALDEIEFISHQKPTEEQNS